VTYYDDDPTASVAVLLNRRGDGESTHPVASLIVNGKPDGNTDGDLQTMAMAGLLPALFAGRAERAFVIGYGTGITAGTLADLDSMRSVTVAEISTAVLHAAPLFDFANHDASHHPKIDLVRSDAYRALLRSEGRFDVIVSEPSNPWVAGTEMLFSREFLAAARDRLTPDGVYVQWYHLYENSDRAVELVLATYASVFDTVAVWRGQFADVLLLGLNDPRAYDLDRLAQRMALPDLSASLARVGISELPQLLVHEIAPPRARRPAGEPVLPPHSLYHPRLSYEAGRGFYTGGQARLPFDSRDPAHPAANRSLLQAYLDRFDGPPPDAVWQQMIQRACLLRMQHCPTLIAAWARTAPPSAVQQQIADLRVPGVPGSWLAAVPALRFLLGDPGSAAPLRSPSELARDTDLFFEHGAYAIPFQPQSLVALWRRCREGGGFGPDCQRGLSEARRFAASGVIPAGWRGARAAPR
jgi:spermidine synthase